MASFLPSFLPRLRLGPNYLTELSLRLAFIGAMLLFACAPVEAFCGNACNACKGECNANHNWVIEALEYQKGQCQVWAASDWNNCLEYAGQWYYYTCLSSGDTGSCWYYMTQMEYACHQAFNQEIARCNSTYDPQINDARASRDSCIQNCNSLQDPPLRRPGARNVALLIQAFDSWDARGSAVTCGALSGQPFSGFQDLHSMPILLR